MSETNKVNAVAHPQPEAITTKDLHKAWFRWWWANEIPHAFDRYISPSLLFGLMPILRKVYKNDEDLREAYRRHLVFFNTQAIWGGGTITGIISSLEENRAKSLAETGEDGGISEEMIQNTKVGLMGALAGIGDAIDSGTVQYIFIAIALPWAQEGSAMGALFPWIGFTLATYLYGWYFTRMGYRLGRNAAAELLTGRIQMYVNGLSILGLFMMGIIAGSYIKVKTPIQFVLSQKEFILNDIVNNILPGVIPLMIVMGVYWYFQKNGLKVTRALLWMTLILGALGAAGILGV